MVEFTPSPEAEVGTPSDLSSEPAQANSASKEEQNGYDGHSSKHAKSISGVATDDDMIDEDNEAGGLFGSGSEDDDEDGSASKKRRLGDQELDSGDDEDRRDRMEEDQDAETYEEKEVLTTSISIGRHAIPHGSDGELYLLKNPQGLGIERNGFTLRSFQPPSMGHHDSAPSSNFSAAQTANTTIRWRRNPDNLHKLQSNSRILRWSDGSLTLQIGSNAMEQLELPAKSLAPPQVNPRKPTPTSIKTSKGSSAPYESRLDSHTYLASIHQGPGFAHLTNHITTSLTVQTTMEENDDALLRLQESMAAAMKGGKGEAAAGPGVISVTEDPELAKRKAEIAERERMRAERRRQNQEQRNRDRQDRVYGRAGRTGYGAGLTVGNLEEDGLATSRARPKPARKPRRRNSEYSEDEDDYRKGRTKEDEYDEDDGFLVGSDEEPEVVPDDSEEEEILGEDADAEGDEDADVKPAKSPKRPREVDDEAAGGTRRRRKVVDDDDDEEG